MNDPNMPCNPWPVLATAPAPAMTFPQPLAWPNQGGHAPPAGFNAPASTAPYRPGVIDDPILPMDDLLGEQRPPVEPLSDARAQLLAKPGCRHCCGRGKVAFAPVGGPEGRRICRCVAKTLEKMG